MPKKNLTNRQRFLYGAVGALSPNVLNLLLVDASAVFASLTVLALAFYAVRLGALSLIGGFWASLHRKEMEPVKLFQLGIVAPALIMGGLNAAQVGKGAAWSPQTVYAQTLQPACAKYKGLLLFARPQETTAEQAQRGLYGKASARTWFVVASLHREFEEAVLAAAKVQAATKQGALVYCAPDRRHPGTPFAVVAGEHLTVQEADALLKRTLEAGFSTAFLFDVANP